MKLNIQKNVNYKQVSFFIIIFLIGITLFYFIVKKLLSHQENPNDRNYISFDNANGDEVIRRMHEMERLIDSSRFAIDNEYCIYFNYTDGIFRILDTNIIGELTYTNLRRNKIFESFSNKNLLRFIDLFHYLNHNNFKLMMYSYSIDQIKFTYKEYYDMYKTWYYDDDLERFVTFKDEWYGGNAANFKIIDSTKDLVLYTFKSANIWGDDIKYQKR